VGYDFQELRHQANSVTVLLAPIYKSENPFILDGTLALLVLDIVLRVETVPVSDAVSSIRIRQDLDANAMLHPVPFLRNHFYFSETSTKSSIDLRGK
jgi:hypothetical protein